MGSAQGLPHLQVLATALSGAHRRKKECRRKRTQAHEVSKLVHQEVLCLFQRTLEQQEDEEGLQAGPEAAGVYARVPRASHGRIHS